MSFSQFAAPSPIALREGALSRDSAPSSRSGGAAGRVRHIPCLSAPAVAGLVLAAWLGACSQSEGDIREPCYPNGTCNAGLICLSEVCVADPADAGSPDSGPDLGYSGAPDGSLFVVPCEEGEYLPISRTDWDGDGIADARDNCPRAPNPDQLDNDADGWGDACDNAPFVSNADQMDRDGDGLGEVIDPDIDGDGILNGPDNCPSVVNPTQRDTSGNGIGDACDPDDDGDGIPDIDDPCPMLPGVIDPSTLGCAGDEDLDGILDQFDNCVGVPNPEQSDIDGDRIGDACDLDIDGDGVLNNLDNAPLAPNPDQLDLDRDGIGDAADAELCFVGAPPDTASCLPLSGPVVARTMGSQRALVGHPTLLRLFVGRLPPLAGFTYTWTVIAGPAEPQFVGGTSSGAPDSEAFIEWTGDISVVAPVSGTYILRVQVTDGTGASTSAELELLVVARC